MLSLLALLACAPDPASKDPAPEAPVPSPADEAPPAGRIGGDPILDWPVVLGSIGTPAVEAAFDGQRAAIEACYAAGRSAHPELHGKVRVRFQIRADGQVAEARTQASSLRHPPTEDCLVAVVRQTPFPPLPSGELAVVDYPFRFERP